MSVITVIALQSVHQPTAKELEAAIAALLAEAERQGFGPQRAQAIYIPRDDGVLETSRVLVRP